MTPLADYAEPRWRAAAALCLSLAVAGGCAGEVHLEEAERAHAEAMQEFELGVRLYLTLPPMADVPEELAAKALAHIEKSHRACPIDCSWSHLPFLMWIAYDARQFNRARSYATEALALVTEPWIGNDHRYAAHLVLGHLSLDEGDAHGAAEHLVAAGRETDNLGLLSHFGPHVDLARKLARHSQRDAVVEYLDLCASTWSRYFGWRLNRWKTQIQSGHIPNMPKPNALLKGMFPVPVTPP